MSVCPTRPLWLYRPHISIQTWTAQTLTNTAFGPEVFLTHPAWRGVCLRLSPDELCVCGADWPCPCCSPGQHSQREKVVGNRTVSLASSSATTDLRCLIRATRHTAVWAVMSRRRHRVDSDSLPVLLCDWLAGTSTSCRGWSRGYWPNWKVVSSLSKSEGKRAGENREQLESGFHSKFKLM